MSLRPRSVVAGRIRERRSCGCTEPPMYKTCANVTCCEGSARIDAVECEASVEVVLRGVRLDGICFSEADRRRGNDIGYICELNVAC